MTLDASSVPSPRRAKRRPPISPISTTGLLRKSLTKLGLSKSKKTRGSVSTSDTLALAETVDLVPTPVEERYNSVLTDNLRNARDPQTFAVVADRLCTRRMELMEDAD
ncbi:hypothetical protein N7447_002906 [Penicillium robsamsonii]|uniref:uncharacterized protein n=1 Tax=Penicillium robsamsonii TaxID=1792511 RepID=UPI00254788C9|nr:uncharacterized protein N7447_002906 [Penicillium robsamsonii]KAJ5836880.1 hypothetical protein N7447_002906 [Penicillium robsamsonii]